MIAPRALVSFVLAAGALGLACEAGPAGTATTTDRGGNCSTCHMPEYQHADPVHVDVKPLTCAVCHIQDGWRPSVVNHPFWPLSVVHAKAECSWCHKGAPTVFKGAPKDCVSCHRQDFDSSTFPGHASFATTCLDCHAPTAWRPAVHVPPPPPVAARPATTTTTPTTPFPKLTTPPSKTPTTTRPTAAPPPPPPPPPRVPTSKPPDVITRPSPRRR